MSFFLICFICLLVVVVVVVCQLIMFHMELRISMQLIDYSFCCHHITPWNINNHFSFRFHFTFIKKIKVFFSGQNFFFVCLFCLLHHFCAWNCIFWGAMEFSLFFCPVFPMIRRKTIEWAHSYSPDHSPFWAKNQAVCPLLWFLIILIHFVCSYYER